MKVEKNNIHIEDSYLYDKQEMKSCLNTIRELYSDVCDVLKNRTDNDMMREWCLHNVLYRLGYQQDRTRDVDLDWPQKWYYRIGYFIFGGICKIFSK